MTKFYRIKVTCRDADGSETSEYVHRLGTSANRAADVAAADFLAKGKEVISALHEVLRKPR